MNDARTLISLVALLAASTACSAGGASESGNGGSGSGSNGSGASGGGIVVGGGGTGAGIGVGGIGAGGVDSTYDNPRTCEEAAANRTYVGCEFWPTLTAHPVWVEFEPAVVIANAGEAAANVTVTGPEGFSQSVSVPAGGLEMVTLAWVPALKGPEYLRPGVGETSEGRLTESAFVPGGAYKLVSDLPVTVWQFNPLNYLKPDMIASTADASLLLPTTAMTEEYRIFGYSSRNEGTTWGTVPGGAAITATKDGTQVQVQLGPNCGFVDPSLTEGLGACVAAGPGVNEGSAGDVQTYTMNAGDVLQLVGAWAKFFEDANADLSGSVVNATAPVQVIAFNAISNLPDGSVGHADHMEEIVLPGQALGTKYIVIPPSAPNGTVVGHVVRIYGNVDGTTLSYSGTRPPGAPDTINAGEVVQLPPIPAGTQCATAADHCMITEPFIVEAQPDHAFAVNSFMVGSTLQMPSAGAEGPSRGDPSQTIMVSPDQFRKEYTFLAPADFVDAYADIIVPSGAEVTLDGDLLTAPQTPIDGEWSYVRATLDPAGGGVHHVSTSDERGLGLQVAGFGNATSFYYPGGLNLELIAPPITIVK